VTRYLADAGERWAARSSAGRQLADAHAAAITGFPPSMLTADYETIGHFMVQRFHAWDQIEAEFGSERIFDEWVARQMVWVRAVPRGLVFHQLVGNLPLAGLYSLLRGIITRNCSLAKLPSRDPISAAGFAQTLIEVDPEHPVARSLSIAYWPHGDELGSLCLAAADAVCVWGGRDAVETVKHQVRVGVPVAEYGPRWSASVVDLERCDPDEAALRVAEDVGWYDQEACFASQRAFVRGGDAVFARFRAALAAHFDGFAARHPNPAPSRDVLAHRSTALLEARFLGLDVDQGDDWAVVIAEGSELPPFGHPLARTLVVHRVPELDVVASELDDTSQTLGVFPWELTERHRDEWARAGAERIVPLGWSRLPRSGWTHDGTYGMHQLVRLVSLDRPRTDFGKHYPRPAEVGSWEREYFLGETWWASTPQTR
jgi:long-chain-fatty-acyl-CoA reductase